MNTKASPKTRTRNTIDNVIIGTLETIRSAFVNVLHLVWENPELSPQEVFDTMAKSEHVSPAELASLVSDIAPLLLKYDPRGLPENIRPPQARLTINPDGTVVVEE